MQLGFNPSYSSRALSQRFTCCLIRARRIAANTPALLYDVGQDISAGDEIEAVFAAVLTSELPSCCRRPNRAMPVRQRTS